MSFYDEDGFQGSEPQVFAGDRSQAESFMTQWYLYTIVNDFDMFMTPCKVAMIFLTYIKGPLVNTWVHQQIQFLREELAQGADEHALAREIKRRFNIKFMDNLQQERARATLRAGVFMEGYEVDEYVATFEELIRHAGYEYSTPQTIDKFTEGIPFALMEKCMTYDRPTTYEEWKTSLEKRVQLQVHMCYDHALLVTGYDVLLSTLQGNLSFSTSSISSFASTHAGPDCFSLFDLRPHHVASSDSCFRPHHVHCLMDSLVPCYLYPISP